jgi:hypothetical protein
MAGNSDGDLFNVTEHHDQRNIGGTPLKEGAGNGDCNNEAL